MTLPIPTHSEAMVDQQGRPTVHWRRYLAQIEAQGNAQLASDVEAIARALGSPDGKVANIPPQAELVATLTARNGIRLFGTLASGNVRFELDQLANTGVGTAVYKTTRDAYGRTEGQVAATTDDLPESASPANLYHTTARARAAAVADTITDGVLDVAPSQNAVFDALAGKAAIPKGYIDGLQLQWVSGTALTVSSGSAYIEASANIVSAPSAIAKTGLSLSASTWYHVYLYLNAGTPDIEIVTTAPAAYSGTARSKTADTTRRYLGSAKTNAAAAIIEFQQNAGGVVSYGGADNSLRNVLSGGTSTVATNISLAALVPVTASHAALLLSNTANTAAGTGVPGSSNPTGFGAGKSYVGYAGPGNDTSFGAHPIDSSQQINYLLSAAPTSGGLYIDAIGYTFGR